ncbi:MAG: mandelate racemase/muconate lactonizing enzyme family protein, partial [Solirubrobacteraceae bacterium]
MRITDCESWIISFPCNPDSRDAEDDHVEVIGVNLTTDDGTTASGFTFTDDGGGGQAIKALIDGLLLPIVRGSEVEPPRAVWPRLWEAVHQLGRGVATMAIAAVDIALWDLQARLNDRPLAREIGQLRDAVPAYGSGKASPFHSIDELIELTMTFVAEDVRAVKVRIGVDPQADIERIAAVRKAVGPEMRIMLDANERLDLATALWFTERVREFDISWLEEPLARDQIGGLQRLRAASPIPLALGEHLFSAAEFVPFVNGGAVDIVQPDACMLGGITEMLRVGELAALHGLTLAPHHIPELHVHLAAALPSASWLERFP